MRACTLPAAIVVGIVGLLLASLPPWPIATRLRHLASLPNCAMALDVGLAPARRGDPGYWRRHDLDRDGVACERWAESSYEMISVHHAAGQRARERERRAVHR